MKPFNFDEWAALAKTDPAAFAQHRADVIAAEIASAPLERQPQLRRLQWRIDMERQRCSNPMHACIHLFNKMWDSVYSERGLLNALLMIQHTQVRNISAKDALPQQPVLSVRPAASATILPFTRPKAVM